MQFNPEEGMIFMSFKVSVVVGKQPRANRQASYELAESLDVVRSAHSDNCSSLSSRSSLRVRDMQRLSARSRN